MQSGYEIGAIFEVDGSSAIDVHVLCIKTRIFSYKKILSTAEPNENTLRLQTIITFTFEAGIVQGIAAKGHASCTA